MHRGAGPTRGSARQERQAEPRQTVGAGDRNVRVLVHGRLDPMLLSLRHRDPERAGRQRLCTRVLAMRVVVGHRERRRQPMHVDVHPLERAHESLRLLERLGAVRADEIVTQRPARNLHPHAVVRLEHPIGQQHTLAALIHRLDGGAMPIKVQATTPRRRRGQRHPHDRQLMVPTLEDRRTVVHLDRHPGSLEAERRHRVGEDRGEEVVSVSLVEVLPLAPVELLGDRRSVDLVDVMDGAGR